MLRVRSGFSDREPGRFVRLAFSSTTTNFSRLSEGDEVHGEPHPLR
jgi:hypothetical protein